MVAGALAHLATHMESGCPRAAYLAAMLLEQVANDASADDHLRRHARELVDILEREEAASDLMHYGQDMILTRSCAPLEKALP
jgi:hypothetical protein